MSKSYVNKPVVPYMMNASYPRIYGDRYRRRGYMNVVNNGYPLYYGGDYYNVPLNKESRQDANKALQMYGQRYKRYNPYLKRWETQLSDIGTVTVERNGKKITKHVHTPYIMSERYITQFELTMLKWRILGIISLSVAIIAVVIVLLVNLL